VGTGITLAVIGAILLFAFRADAGPLDLQVTGAILILAGIGVMAWSRRTVRRKRVITESTNPTDEGPVEVVETTIIERTDD
jgi:Na+/melibiose symporter-like transporter